MNERTPQIAAVVPAHNEEDTIAYTIRSLMEQTRPPDTILVVADNCTDETVTVVRRLQEKYLNLTVMETTKNGGKKAGALNQGFATFNSPDYLLFMDADTDLDPQLIERAVEILGGDPNLAAVCSRAGVAPSSENSLWKRFLWHIQHLEYGSFDSHRVETEGKIKVVHGMAAMYRFEALRQVGEYRQKRWGTPPYQIYDEENLTEDYELTLCLKDLGWKVTIGLSMRAWTKVPLALKELWRQRLRWLRGGVDSLRKHGWSDATRKDILFDHILFVILLFLQTLIVILIAIALSRGHPWGLSPWFLAVVILGYLDALYRMKYVQELKPTDVIIRILLIPELVYQWFQMAIMISSYHHSFAEVDQSW